MDDNQPPPTAYEDLGPTRPSTCSNVLPLRKPPSAAIQRLIGELGLRYRPSAQADLQAHAASLALLASDLADIPPDFLDRAIKQWVRQSQFMPKAAELAAIAQGMTTKSQRDPQALCDHGNSNLAQIGRDDIRWIVVDGQPSLEPAFPPQPSGPKIQGKFTEAELIAMAKQANAYHDAKRRGILPTPGPTP